MFIVGIEALPTLQGASLAPLLACSCSSIGGNDSGEKNHCASSSLQDSLSVQSPSIITWITAANTH